MKKQSEKNISEYTLPERLKYFRLNRKLSQIEMAKLAKLSQSTIAQIESGQKDPSISTLKSLAQVLDVEIATLFASDDVHVFDMKRLYKRYDSIDKLNATLYRAVGEVVRYSKKIGWG